MHNIIKKLSCEDGRIMSFNIFRCLFCSISSGLASNAMRGITRPIPKISKTADVSIMNRREKHISRSLNVKRFNNCLNIKSMIRFKTP